MVRDPRPGADGAVVGTAAELSASARYFFHDPVCLAKTAANLVRLLLHSSFDFERKLELGWTQQSWPARLLLLAMAPIGVAAWLRDRARLGTR
jgi:hypothetical protein